MAIDNVKNNLGSNCVTEDHVREVCRTMLDEAKLMYSNPPLSGSNSPFNTAQTTDTLIESRFAKQHSKVNIQLVLGINTYNNILINNVGYYRTDLYLNAKSHPFKKLKITFPLLLNKHLLRHHW